VKNKILLRLILYFAVSFITFAAIIAIVFSTLFSRHNVAVHTVELERRAVSIANTFSEIVDNGIGGWRFYGLGDGAEREMIGFGRGMFSLGAFLHFVEDIAMTDVWIVDQDLGQISFGHRIWGVDTFRDLPAGAEHVVLLALSGETSTSEIFSTLLDVPTVTVATPIILSNGEIMGAVLLHSQISLITEATTSGVLIFLLSTVAAIIAALFVAVVLSSRFTRPLKMMKKAAIKISDGDYLAKTGVHQSDEIGELAVVLDDMADRLDKSSQESAKLEKLRRDFVANISHELRTPLTVIRGSLESLCDGIVKDADDVKDYHYQMLSESKYLERLVSDLLDLARLQNLDFAIEMQKIDLKYIADDVIRSMRHIAERKGVEIVPRYNEESYPVMGDYSRLRQMLIIFLDNAIKFSAEGRSVEVVLSQLETGIKVSVHDDGCGIDAEDIPYIFERFYKQRSEENKAGTGLGLAIAKQIADRHDASVRVESVQGEGATFAFIFKSI